MKTELSVKDWIKENKKHFSVNKPESKVKAAEVKSSKPEFNNVRPNKRAFKNEWLKITAEAWQKIQKKYGVKSSVIAALSNLFETELKAISMKELNGVNFIAYEYRLNGLAAFLKDMKRVLRKHPKLAKRVIDIYANKFSTMIETAVENQYLAVDADYCGELRTFIAEVEKMLAKKIVPVGGNLCFTFKKTSRKIKGVDATQQMRELVAKFPNWKFVKLFNSNLDMFEYRDSESGKSHFMVGCILERVK
jgi:hypothetical protein